MNPGSDGAGSVDDLFAAAYDELRRWASAVKGRDQSLTLNPTALVHEAWLKLSRSPGIAAASRLHFKRIAARAMREVLIEAARHRNRLKRGGGTSAVLITMEGPEARTTLAVDDLLALDVALQELARMNPRQATIVESRFFGGLEFAEIAELLQVSEPTVFRDWRAARAWLNSELRKT